MDPILLVAVVGVVGTAIGAIVSGFFALKSQKLSASQELNRWRSDEKRWKAERRWITLTELSEALNEGVFAFTTYVPPQEPRDRDAFYFTFLANIHRAAVRAMPYLPTDLGRRTQPALEAYRGAIAAQIEAIEGRKSKKDDERFKAYTATLTDFNLELRRLMVPE